MKKNNKVSDIFGVICVVSIFAGCVEGFDGGITLWTGICLLVAVVTGIISRATDEVKTITNDTESDEQE